jgi:hypothetical protein
LGVGFDDPTFDVVDEKVESNLGLHKTAADERGLGRNLTPGLDHRWDVQCYAVRH